MYPVHDDIYLMSAAGLMGLVETNVAYDPNDASKQDWKSWSLTTWVNSRTNWNPIITDNTYPWWNPGAKAPGVPGVSTLRFQNNSGCD